MASLNGFTIKLVEFYEVHLHGNVGVEEML